MNPAETKGNLFDIVGKESLAHCVSRDLRMSKGIAVEFKSRFGRVDMLKSQNCRVGDVAVLKEGEHFIYYLVTKEVYWGKPTYESLDKCLVAMKAHALANNVSSISMPKIGCGLDGLDWRRVKGMISRIFPATSKEQGAIQVTIHIV